MKRQDPCGRLGFMDFRLLRRRLGLFCNMSRDATKRTQEKNDMSEAKAPVGQIRTEVRGHVLKIIIDNPAKKNSFRPQMMYQMSDALTLLDSTDEYWVGVVSSEVADLTACLDM